MKNAAISLFLALALVPSIGSGSQNPIRSRELIQAISPSVNKTQVCKQYGEAAIYISGLIYQMNLEQIRKTIKGKFPLVIEEHMEGIIAFILTPPIVSGSISAEYLVGKCMELKTADERNERHEMRMIER